MPVPMSGAGVAADGNDRAGQAVRPADAVGDVCFAAIVRDSTGQLSQSGDVAGLRATRPRRPSSAAAAWRGARGGRGWALAVAGAGRAPASAPDPDPLTT